MAIFKYVNLMVRVFLIHLLAALGMLSFDLGVRNLVILFRPVNMFSFLCRSCKFVCRRNAVLTNGFGPLIFVSYGIADVHHLMFMWYIGRFPR